MTTSSLQTQSYTNNALAAGLVPRVENANPTSFPPPGGGGVTVEGAIFADVDIVVREHPDYMTTRCQVTTTDLTATYTATVNGNAVAYDAAAAAPADLAELVQEWAAAINADVTVGPLVTADAADLDGDGLDDSIVIRGDSQQPFTIAYSATGSAVLATFRDAQTCCWRIYGRVTEGGTTPTAPDDAARQVAWKRMLDESGRQLCGMTVIENDTIRVDVRGYSALYVQLYRVGYPSLTSFTQEAQAIVRPCRVSGS